jgi:hypothetical protein
LNALRPMRVSKHTRGFFTKYSQSSMLRYAVIFCSTRRTPSRRPPISAV